MCMYNSRKALLSHSVGKNPSVQRNEVKDIYILNREVIATLTLLKTSSKWFNILVFQLFIHNIEILCASFMTILFDCKKGKISEEVHSILPLSLSLSCTHSRIFTGFVNTLPCDDKESTEVGWREVENRSFRMTKVWNAWLLQQIVPRLWTTDQSC